MIDEIHVNDVGTTFTVTIKDQDDVVVDISGAIDYDLIFRKPDNTIVTKTASLVTDGTDGKISYTFVDGDLDQYGLWHVQAFVDFGSTEWSSDIHKFKVHKNIGC